MPRTADAHPARTIWARIGGPNSVTWPGFWITTGIGLITNIATTGLSQTVAEPRSLAAILAGSAASYALLAIARSTLLRQARVRPVPGRTIAAFAVCTVGGGIASSIVAAALGLEREGAATPDASTIAIGVLASITTGVVMLALSAVAVDGWREHRVIEARIARLTARVTELTERVAQAHEDESMRLRSDLAALILDSLRTTRIGDPAVMSARLRGVVDDVVRPLSRSLLTPVAIPVSHSAPRPRFSVARLAADAAAAPLLFPAAWASIVAVPTFFSVALSSSARHAVAATVAACACTALWASAANFAQRRRPRALGPSGWLVVAVGTVAGAALSTAGTLRLVDPGASRGAAPFVAIIIQPAVALLLAAAKLQGAAAERQRVALEYLQADADWHEARTRGAEWAMRNTVSRALHGPVQSALIAAAHRIDVLTGNPDSQTATDHVVAEVADVLKSFAAATAPDTDIEVTFRRLTTMWSSVCAIETHLSESAITRLAVDADCALIAGEVITEACSNAIRHDRARSLRLDVRDEGRALAITATSTGNPGSASGEGGMGTQLLDHVSLGWSREVDDEGSRLEVLLPLA